MSSGSELELDDDVVSVSATKDNIERTARLNAELHELLQKCFQISSEITQLQPTVVEPPQVQNPQEHQPPEESGIEWGPDFQMRPFLPLPSSLLVAPAVLQPLENKGSSQGPSKISLEESELLPLLPNEQPPIQETAQDSQLPFGTPSRRLIILGLCTTADLASLPIDEYNAFRRRLERVLLWTTSDAAIDHHPEAVDLAPPYVCFSKQFELGVLHAFGDFGLDLSERLGVRGTATENGGKKVIASDIDVDALVWIKGLLEDPKLGPISKRDIILYANHMRSRLIGQPVSPVLMREYLWRTLTSTILYLEGRSMY